MRRFHKARYLSVNMWRTTRTIPLVLGLAGPAAAQDDGFDADADADAVDEGPEFGVRLGYGVPSGDVGGTRTRDGRLDGAQRTLEARLAGAALFGIDLGYRFHPRWFVGGYGEYAMAATAESAKTECDDCQFTWLHLALSLQYRVLVLPRGDVWLGVGTGHQWLNGLFADRVESGPHQVLRDRSETYSGPEYLHLQFGATLRPLQGVAFGPYTGMSIGSFDEGVARCTPDNLCPYDREDIDVGDPGAHLWFTTGIRVVFLP